MSLLCPGDQVTMDLCKLFYAKFINNDLDMYDDVNDVPAHSNSTALSEDLGQVGVSLDRVPRCTVIVSKCVRVCKRVCVFVMCVAVVATCTGGVHPHRQDGHADGEPHGAEGVHHRHRTVRAVQHDGQPGR